MFEKIRNGDGSSTIRCRVTDRTWLSTGQADREQTERIAEQMQRTLLYDKMGLDPNEPRSIDDYREAYQKYMRKK